MIPVVPTARANKVTTSAWAKWEKKSGNGKIASFQTFSRLNLGKPSAFDATAAQTWGNSGRTSPGSREGREEQKLKKGGRKRRTLYGLKFIKRGTRGLNYAATFAAHLRCNPFSMSITRQRNNALSEKFRFNTTRLNEKPGERGRGLEVVFGRREQTPLLQLF